MIECVNICLTDRCNRSCPECCCDVPRIKDHWEISLEGIFRAAWYTSGIRRVTLTGGEPTQYSKFDWIAKNGKSIFECDSFEVETNGKMQDSTLELLSYFDVVTVTRYEKPYFNESNEADIEKIRAVVPDSILNIGSEPIRHVSRSRRGTGSCSRGSGITVALYKDRVYPCCMGWGIGTSESVKISKNWERDVLALPRPCKDCFFS